MKSFVLIVVAFFFCLLSLDAQSPPQVEKNQPPLDPKNMDTSVKPQDDFFMYADGGWIKRTEIPPEYSRWGGFNELIERNNDALHVIAEKAADTHVDPRLAPEVQKVGDYYTSGMDERDYYTKTDEASKKLRDQYVDHVAKMLTLLGEPAATASNYAKKILALETRLAQASRTRVQLRDPQKNYNKLPVSQLQNLTPDWHWSDYFKQINLLEPPNVNVHQPEFFKAADEVFKNTPIEDWKAYLRWQLIDATAAE